MLFGSSTPPEPMGDYTGFLLNWVGARSRESFAIAMEEMGLRPQQFAAMVVIDANPGMAQQDLVEATNIDPSTMVAMLDALEQSGLAERRPHPTDRRKRALHLTAKGERKLADARAAAKRVGGQTFGALEPAELAELHRLLRKLAGFAKP
ncbi:MAG TPA: MarR family winged helix-turn-helix transcriptional regulator [Solirubrobacteraceae bacterium]